MEKKIAHGQKSRTPLSWPLRRPRPTRRAMQWTRNTNRTHLERDTIDIHSVDGRKGEGA
jgi:hypothetical protein